MFLTSIFSMGGCQGSCDCEGMFLTSEGFWPPNSEEMMSSPFLLSSSLMYETSPRGGLLRSVPITFRALVLRRGLRPRGEFGGCGELPPSARP
mmetsp:Transcript_53686/g.94723  ORF Transcript_53686/g.94723 Transcript_53686/m.94723 type:complete len:93 (-) Transcript_53686:181-459(-)